MTTQEQAGPVHRCVLAQQHQTCVETGRVCAGLSRPAQGVGEEWQEGGTEVFGGAGTRGRVVELGRGVRPAWVAWLKS